MDREKQGAVHKARKRRSPMAAELLEVQINDEESEPARSTDREHHLENEEQQNGAYFPMKRNEIEI